MPDLSRFATLAASLGRAVPPAVPPVPPAPMGGGTGSTALKPAEIRHFLGAVPPVPPVPPENSVSVQEVEKAEREAIQSEYPATLPAREHRRLVSGYLAAGLQRPPSWANPSAVPMQGAWCSCCSRHEQAGGRWWREAVNPSGWCCWTCHPPDHLSPDAVVERRT
jgi:hypothetical protein